MSNPRAKKGLKLNKLGNPEWEEEGDKPSMGAISILKYRICEKRLMDTERILADNK